jgi:hypothetical protein
LLKKPSSAADQEVVAIRVDIAEQRSADRIRAEAIWMLRVGDDAALLARPRAGVICRSRDVLALIDVARHRLVVEAHPDVAAADGVGTVTASPTPPSAVLPG